MVPAVIAVIASGGATVFFFYPPIYSFLIEDPQHLVELLLFGFVGIVTGLLATNLKRQADLARRNETEVRELYTFSRPRSSAKQKVRKVPDTTDDMPEFFVPPLPHRKKLSEIRDRALLF